MLEMVGIYKTFSGRGQRIHALSNFSLSAKVGELLAVVGPNGSGKSTALKVIAGLVSPDSGGVLLAGQSLDVRKARPRLAAVLDGGRNLYPRLTVMENLTYYGALNGLDTAAARRRANELLEQFDLVAKKDELYQKLSRGMQQRISLLRALLNKPKILVLDEPTLGMDSESQEILLATLVELVGGGMSIIVTTHQLEVVQQIASRIAFLRHGTVVSVLDRSQLDAFLKEDVKTVVRFAKDALDTDASLALLKRWEWSYADNSIRVVVETKHLYDLFDEIRPARIISVEQTTSPLLAAYERLCTEP